VIGDNRFLPNAMAFSSLISLLHMDVLKSAILRKSDKQQRAINITVKLRNQTGNSSKGF
jgi:hypothetical protein